MGKTGDFIAYNEYENNPFFVEGVTKRWIEKNNSVKEMQMVDQQTGEMFIAMTVPKMVMVAHDPMRYAKVLKDKDISGLSWCSKLILFYVAYNLPINKAEIILHYVSVTKWCDISKNRFYDGIKGLLDTDILAIKSKKDNSYYVNPNYVFNGNRTKI